MKYNTFYALNSTVLYIVRDQLPAPYSRQFYQQQRINMEYYSRSFKDSTLSFEGMLASNEMIALRTASKVFEAERKYAQSFNCVEQLVSLMRKQRYDIREITKFISESAYQSNRNAMELLQQNQPKSALALLKQTDQLLIEFECKELAPIQNLTYNNLACSYKKAGNLQKALECLEKGVDICLQYDVKENLAITHLNICAILGQVKKHRAALDHAVKAAFQFQEDLLRVQSSPEKQQTELSEKTSLLGVAFYNMGMQEEAMGNISPAIEWYRKACSTLDNIETADPKLRTSFYTALEQAVGKIKVGASNPRTLFKTAKGFSDVLLDKNSLQAASRPQSAKKRNITFGALRGGSQKYIVPAFSKTNISFSSPGASSQRKKKPAVKRVLTSSKKALNYSGNEKGKLSKSIKSSKDHIDPITKRMLLSEIEDKLGKEWKKTKSAYLPHASTEEDSKLPSANNIIVNIFTEKANSQEDLEDDEVQYEIPQLQELGVLEWSDTESPIKNDYNKTHKKASDEILEEIDHDENLDKKKQHKKKTIEDYEKESINDEEIKEIVDEQENESDKGIKKKKDKKKKKEKTDEEKVEPGECSVEETPEKAKDHKKKKPKKKKKDKADLDNGSEEQASEKDKTKADKKKYKKKKDKYDEDSNIGKANKEEKEKPSKKKKKNKTHDKEKSVEEEVVEPNEDAAEEKPAKDKVKADKDPNKKKHKKDNTIHGGSNEGKLHKPEDSNKNKLNKDAENEESIEEKKFDEEKLPKEKIKSDPEKKKAESSQVYNKENTNKVIDKGEIKKAKPIKAPIVQQQDTSKKLSEEEAAKKIQRKYKKHFATEYKALKQKKGDFEAFYRGLYKSTDSPDKLFFLVLRGSKLRKIADVQLVQAKPYVKVCHFERQVENAEGLNKRGLKKTWKKAAKNSKGIIREDAEIYFDELEKYGDDTSMEDELLNYGLKDMIFNVVEEEKDSKIKDPKGIMMDNAESMVVGNPVEEEEFEVIQEVGDGDALKCENNEEKSGLEKDVKKVTMTSPKNKKDVKEKELKREEEDDDLIEEYSSIRETGKVEETPKHVLKKEEKVRELAMKAEIGKEEANTQTVKHEQKKNEEDKELEQAVRKIQNKFKLRFKGSKNAVTDPKKPETVVPEVHKDLKLDSYATKIQKIYRGHYARSQCKLHNQNKPPGECVFRNATHIGSKYYIVKGFYDKTTAQLGLRFYDSTKKTSECIYVPNFYIEDSEEIKGRIEQILDSVKFNTETQKLFIVNAQSPIHSLPLSEICDLDSMKELFEGTMSVGGHDFLVNFLVNPEGGITIHSTNEESDTTQTFPLPEELIRHVIHYKGETPAEDSINSLARLLQLNASGDKLEFIKERVNKLCKKNEEIETNEKVAVVQRTYKSWKSKELEKEDLALEAKKMETLIIQGIKMGDRYVLVKALLDKEDKDTLMFKIGKENKTIVRKLSQLFTKDRLNRYKADPSELKKVLRYNLVQLVSSESEQDKTVDGEKKNYSPQPVIIVDVYLLIQQYANRFNKDGQTLVNLQTNAQKTHFCLSAGQNSLERVRKPTTEATFPYVQKGIALIKTIQVDLTKKK
eukprot:TRINITY_DN872_c0_g1_i1.p1 TRINITY_DN872_c0_g1~~TRINITY_DN872_c0_g1_i1.p1  ORF type:complete len:1576 (+),score=322.07 TRINITY_DN872_c0_g1_i1:18908-23635(+)